MVILQATDYNLQRLHHQHLSAPFPSTSLTAYLMTEEDFTCTYLFYGSIPSLGHFLHSCPCLRQKPEDFQCNLHCLTPLATLPNTPSAASCPRPVLWSQEGGEIGQMPRMGDKAWKLQPPQEHHSDFPRRQVEFVFRIWFMFYGRTHTQKNIFPSHVCLLVNNSSFQLNSFFFFAVM